MMNWEKFLSCFEANTVLDNFVIQISWKGITLFKLAYFPQMKIWNPLWCICQMQLVSVHDVYWYNCIVSQGSSSYYDYMLSVRRWSWTEWLSYLKMLLFLENDMKIEVLQWQSHADRSRVKSCNITGCCLIWLWSENFHDLCSLLVLLG